MHLIQALVIYIRILSHVDVDISGKAKSILIGDRGDTNVNSKIKT